METWQYWDAPLSLRIKTSTSRGCSPSGSNRGVWSCAAAIALRGSLGSESTGWGITAAATSIIAAVRNPEHTDTRAGLTGGTQGQENEIASGELAEHHAEERAK